ncbi:hypothetical protein [Paraburkholderia caledonica]|uniref:DUF3108 domain-containing protein n=1 Tax=Paraburkholderia caledonica TaxID=134536 RepID=A0AB73INZ7_9BURK|nr:hypothetical protein [Paraburkholderia caledonica]
MLLSYMLASTALADTQYFHKTFDGHIDGRYAFKMDLKNVDGSLSGSYRYVGKREDISLSGNIDGAGTFTMDESGNAGQRTGSFTGKVAGDALVGTWTSARGDRRFAITAHQTSEVIIGSKREILTQAVGTYALDRVSGEGGANAMWDSWRDRGGWESKVSSIYQAQREASDVTLTREDLRRLNSMNVTVDTTLTTRLTVDGKVLLSVPYREAGMQYEIALSHDSVVENDLKKLSPATTVRDEHLYLLARDAIDFVPAMSGSYLPDDAVDIATVRYSVVGKTFELYLRDGQCCGGTVFTFRRKNR